MWKTLSPPNLNAPVQRAAWETPSGCGRVEIADDFSSIAIRLADDSWMLSIQPVDVDHLPALEEEYIRGDQWHCWMPQGEKDLYSLKLAIRTIHCDADRWIFEAIFSIQTLFLDTHPTLDLVVSGRPDAMPRLLQGCPPISTVQLAEGGSVAVLLAPTDAPFTGQCSTDRELRLRLFGEFLEKGVIRKSRPWFILDRSARVIDEGELKTWLSELSNSPPPLTP